MVRAMYTIKAVRGDGKPLPLQEPPSWWTPFRNDFAEERLKEALEAPFQHEAWASLIPGKYTPKVKPFGYAQHRTQDDFETKEYRDRLLSRQFFNQPQQFQVIPERQETSVRFGGKWEYQRVCGFPSVDRTELENGWAPTDLLISSAEEAVVEQAIRDVSGNRPGNYIKRPSELSNLNLQESWWQAWKYGWEECNRMQRAFHHPTEQAFVDPTKLPFQGRIPPFGTSYGMGERIQEIVRDYSKGFGLGPTGHTSGVDQVQPGAGSDAHVRAQEEKRVQTLGLGNALVRLFDEKIAKDPSYRGGDLYAWALAQSHAFGGSHGMVNSGGGGGNRMGAMPHSASPFRHSGLPIRALLLSLQAWREKGQPPSHLLQTFLSEYLREEVAEFNHGLPPHVPKLMIQPPSPLFPSTVGGGGNSSGGGATTTAAASASSLSPSAPLSGIRETSAVGGQIWAEVDRLQYAYEYQQQRPHVVAFAADSSSGGGSGSGGGVMGGSGSYVLDLIHRACGEACLRVPGMGGGRAAAGGSAGQSSAELEGSYGGGGGGSSAEAERLQGILLEQVTAQFQHALAGVVNQGISPVFLSQCTSNAQRGSRTSSATAIPYVRLSAVIPLLQRFGVSAEQVEVVRQGIRGSGITEVRSLPASATVAVPSPLLRGADEAQGSSPSSSRSPLSTTLEAPRGEEARGEDATDVVVPVTTLLSWTGPTTMISSSPASPSSSSSRGGGVGFSGFTAIAHRAVGGSSSGSGGTNPTAVGTSARPLIMTEVFDALSVYHDGYMADVQYIMERNFYHPILRQEFMQTFLPIFQKDGKKVSALYEAYSRGQWVPNVKEAIDAFVAFLGAYASKPEAIRASAAVDYFETVPSSSSSSSSGMVYASPPRIRFLPPELGPFQFENTLVETIQTRRRFDRYNITAGPNAAIPVMWMAPTTSATAYCTPQPSTDLVQVRRERDFGLAKALEKSPHKEKMSATPHLRSLLTSPFLLVANFNRFYHRVLPMLHVFQGVLQEYHQRVVGGSGGAGSKLDLAEDERRELSTLLEQESFNTAIEQEFRRNSERYWRNVIDGRGAAASGGGGGRFGRGGSGGFGPGGSRYPARTSSLGAVSGGTPNPVAAASMRSLGASGKATGASSPSSSSSSTVGRSGSGKSSATPPPSSSSTPRSTPSASSATTAGRTAGSSSSSSSSSSGKTGGKGNLTKGRSSPSSSSSTTTSSSNKAALQNLLGNVLQKKKRK